MRSSDALGFGVDGGVWVKDETGQVAGSHKARHLDHDPAAPVDRRVVGSVRRGRPRPTARHWRSRRVATLRSRRRRWRPRSDGRFESSCHRTPTPRCWHASSSWARTSSSARADPPIPPAIRASIASARRSPAVPSRSRCREPRTCGASTAVAPSVGRWPGISRRTSWVRRSTGSSSRSARARSRRPRSPGSG